MTMLFQGKCSTFGGANDKGMGPRPGKPEGDTGLSFYEPFEADLRPDIFLPAPADFPLQETWKRLRPEFPYIALNVDHSKTRIEWRIIPWSVCNPKTGQWAVAFLVDRGPGDPRRVCDLSPGIASRLRLETDDDVVVSDLI